MTLLKFITVFNWLIIGVDGCFVIRILVQANGATDAAGRGQETAAKGFMFLLLLVMAGLNASSHQWMKIIALILSVIFLFVIFQMMS